MVIVEDFLPLELGSLDVIFEVKWLSMLGETSNNWQELTMKINMGDSVVMLRGDSTLCKLSVLVKSLLKVCQCKCEGLFVECGNLIA